MRQLDSNEVQEVSGGLVKASLVIGGVLAWAHANRSSLKAIKDAAVAEANRLEAEH